MQVETASDYGIELNDTPRVSRGHRDLDLSTAEWRANERGEMKGRSVKRQVYAKTAQGYVDDAIAREAVALRKLSERMQDAGTPKRRREARALERAAFTLMSGGTLDEGPGFMREATPERQPESVPQEREDKSATLKQADTDARAAKREAEHAEIERQWKRDHERQQQQAQERHRKRMERLAKLMQMEECGSHDNHDDAGRKAEARGTVKARRGDRAPERAEEFYAPNRFIPKGTNTRDVPVERLRQDIPVHNAIPMSGQTEDTDHSSAIPHPPDWKWQGFDSLPRAPEDSGERDASRPRGYDNRSRVPAYRDREQEPRKSLSEKELRELLQNRERKMIEQERQRSERVNPEPGRDRGGGYGFD